MQGSASLEAGVLAALGASTLLGPRCPDCTCAQTCLGSPVASAGAVGASWVWTLAVSCAVCVAEAWVIGRLWLRRGSSVPQQGTLAASSAASLTDDVSGQNRVGATPSSLGRPRRAPGSPA